MGIVPPFLPLALLFQIILEHENSEPRVTQLRVKFTQVLSAFQMRVDRDLYPEDLVLGMAIKFTSLNGKTHQ